MSKRHNDRKATHPCRNRGTRQALRRLDRELAGEGESDFYAQQSNGGFEPGMYPERVPFSVTRKKLSSPHTGHIMVGAHAKIGGDKLQKVMKASGLSTIPGGSLVTHEKPLTKTAKRKLKRKQLVGATSDSSGSGTMGVASKWRA